MASGFAVAVLLVATIMPLLPNLFADLTGDPTHESPANWWRVRMIELALRLVPDDLWAIVHPVLPPAAVRPQGGGRARVDDRRIFVAIVYVLTAHCAWRRTPACFGVAVATVYRRYGEWTRAGLWNRLAASDNEWARAIAHAAAERSTDGASAPGPVEHDGSEIEAPVNTVETGELMARFGAP
jgi:transposase